MSVVMVVVETEKPVDAGDLGTAKIIVHSVMAAELGRLKWSGAMFCDRPLSAALREKMAPARHAHCGDTG